MIYIIVCHTLLAINASQTHVVTIYNGSSMADINNRRPRPVPPGRRTSSHRAVLCGFFPGEGLDNTFGHALRNTSLHNVFALCTV